MKTAICTAAGIVGGAIAAALGGWDFAVKALLICMAIDYASGWVVAAVFHKSPKTETGSLASGVGLVGLARKAMMFAFVVIGNLMDQMLSVAYLRDAITVGFMCNEILSITISIHPPRGGWDSKSAQYFSYAFCAINKIRSLFHWVFSLPG